jgi:hypothetical protein
MGLVYHCCCPASAHTDSMPVRLRPIVADAHDLPGLARFRTQAPGSKVLCAREGEIVIGTRENAAVGLCFMPVTDSKTVKDRLHLDLTSSAQVLGRPGRPGGNQFCVMRPKETLTPVRLAPEGSAALAGHRRGRGRGSGG